MSIRKNKFRAWDVIGRKWIIGASNINWDNCIISIPSSYENQFVFCEYIGFKDKNGKEICESDIVKFRSHPSKQIIGEVYYCNERATFEIKSADAWEKSKGTHSINNFSHVTSVEIIGNIYENIDMLTA